MNKGNIQISLGTQKIKISVILLNAERKRPKNVKTSMERGAIIEQLKKSFNFITCSITYMQPAGE